MMTSPNSSTESKLEIVLYRYHQPNPYIDRALEAWISFLQGSSYSYRVCEALEYVPAPIAIVWGVPKKTHSKKLYQAKQRIYQEQEQRGFRCLVIETGFLKRDRYYSVGWNANVGFGEYYLEGTTPHRWEQLQLSLSPPRPAPEAGVILICGQVPWDTQLVHVDYLDWLKKTIQLLSQITSIPVVLRLHPKMSRKMALKRCPEIYQLPVTYSQQDNLEEDLARARVVVAFNSNSLIDAMRLGIPVIGVDRGSVVSDYLEHDLTQVEQVQALSMETMQTALQQVAYMQWNTEEIASGEAFAWISRLISPEKV